jgi:small subunit ribosomal protein S6
MRPYEIMIILDPALDDEAVRGVVERVNEVVRSHGGLPGKVDYLGKRRLAYEIAHRAEGNYVAWRAMAEPDAIGAAHRYLSLADEVLRHKVIRLPDKLSKHQTALQVVEPSKTP